MPANFPEVWLGRIRQNLDQSDKATFLDGIPEIAADVHQINQGTATEKNIIYVPTTDFETEVLINNNTYPIPFQEYEDDTIQITLDKYQTKVVTLKDDDTLGASYDKIDVVTKSGKRAIVTSKYKKAIHSIAPLSNTVSTPVIAVTGGPNALADADGRKRLTYEDLVIAAGKFGEGRLVLNKLHWNDLLMDRKNFGDKLVNYVKGTLAPEILGFEIHKYDGAMPIFTAAKAKKPYGSIQDADDLIGSVFFDKEAIGKKTGVTKQYFVKAENNPTRQSNDLSYRHYFVAVPYKAEKIGALI